jgi:WD40 repeat protein
MKKMAFRDKMFSFLIVCFLLTFSFSSYSQVKLGGQLGLNFSSASYSATDNYLVSPSKSKILFMGGIISEIKLDNLFALEPGLNYVQRGIEYDPLVDALTGAQLPGTSGTLTLNYIDIPILLKAKFDEGQLRHYLMAGPNIGFLSVADVEPRGAGLTTTSSKKDQLNSMNFSFDLGGGVEYSLDQHTDLFANLKYSIGLTDIIKSDRFMINPVTDGDHFKHYTYGLQLSFGIKFCISGCDEPPPPPPDPVPLFWEGHFGPVNSVSYSKTPGSSYIASGGDDGIVRIWDANSGNLLKSLNGHRDVVTSVAFSPKHNKVASGSMDNSIKIWDVYTGTLQVTMTDHKLGVTSVSFSKDGSEIASGSDDGTIKIWDVQTGKLLKTMIGHLDHVNSVDFSNDGKFLVSGSKDNTVRVWDVDYEKCKKVFLSHNGPVNTVSFSNDGNRIASGSSDSTIKIWDAINYRLLWTFNAHADKIKALAFSPTDRFLLSGGADAAINLWDLDSTVCCLNSKWTASYKKHIAPVTAVAFSPFNNEFTSCSKDQSIIIWNLLTGKPRIINKECHTAKVNSVSFKQDGLKLFSAGDDGSIKIWNTQLSETNVVPNLLNSLVGNNSSITTIAYSPKDDIIISGSADKTMKVWNASSGNLLHSLPDYHSDYITSIVFSKDGTKFASTSLDRTVNIWNVPDIRTANPPKTIIRHFEGITCSAFSPDGKNIVTGSWDNKIKIWNIETGDSILTLNKHSDGITCLIFNPYGDKIISGGWDKIIRVWDALDGSLIRMIEGHTDGITSITMIPNSNILVSASKDGTIRFTNIDNGINVFRINYDVIGYPQSISFSRDGKKMAVGGWGNNNLRIYPLPRQILMR